MTQPMANGRRRIDRVLADDYLDGLADRSLDEVRALRNDAEQEEADLSYVRRLLQGRMDLVRAEQARRTASGGAPLIDLLAEVLADGPRSDRGLRPVPDRRAVPRRRPPPPGRADRLRRRHLRRRRPQRRRARRPSLEALSQHEETVSDLRRRVQTVMDGLTAEIGRRYRDGEADVSRAAQPRQLMDLPVVAEVVRSGFVEGATAGRSWRSTPTARSRSRSACPTSRCSPAPPTSRSRPSACSRCGLDLDGELLALSAASHSGEDFHIDGVRPHPRRRRPRARVALQNPTDLPYGEAARADMAARRAASPTGWP